MKYGKDNLFHWFDDQEYSHKQNEYYKHFRKAINYKMQNVSIDHKFRK